MLLVRTPMIAPTRIYDALPTLGYQLFPESQPAGEGAPEQRVSTESIAFGHLLRGIHW